MLLAVLLALFGFISLFGLTLVGFAVPWFCGFSDFKVGFCTRIYLGVFGNMG